MTADAEKTGTETMTVDAETDVIMTVTGEMAATEKTETMTADAENAVNPEWIPDPLFLSRDREHADAKDHRTVTEKVCPDVREKIPHIFFDISSVKYYT